MVSAKHKKVAIDSMSNRIIEAMDVEKPHSSILFRLTYLLHSTENLEQISIDSAPIFFLCQKVPQKWWI